MVFPRFRFMFLFAAVGVVGGSLLMADDEFPLYVGQRICLQCHRYAYPDGDGKIPIPDVRPALDGEPSDVAASEIEPSSGAAPCTCKSAAAHAGAYRLLRRTEADAIAAISGLPRPPVQSRICLDCHGTAADEGPRWTLPSFDPTDGVQCEGCHGPGSLHVNAAGAGSLNAANARTDGTPSVGRESARAEARGSQDAPGAAAGVFPGRRVNCDACHVERPSHREVLEKGFRVTAADRAYKTPVDLAIAPDGSQLYVVCQNSNSLLVVDLTARRVEAEINVGRRPDAVALSDDGSRAYVSNRLDDTLSVIDTRSLTVVVTVPVGHEPHGIAIAPRGEYVFVLNTGDDTVSVLDASTLAEVRRLAAGAGPWSIAQCGPGAAAYVTNVRPFMTPFRDPTRSEITVIDTETGVVSRRLRVPDANMLQGITCDSARGTVLFTLARTKHLVPGTRLQQGWVITNGLGIISPDGGIAQVLLDEPNRGFADVYDVALSPDGRQALAVSGGANEVAVVDVNSLLDTIRESTDEARRDVLPNHLGMSERFVVKRIKVGRNPRAVVYAPNGRRAYVANTLNDSVSVIDTVSLSVEARIDLGGPTEVTHLRWGERLFHDARHTYGHQFSCRSCHPDGHVNGLSLDIEPDGAGLLPVDNRTLRGIVDTPPFKWEGTNPTMQRQCGPRLAVFFTRVEPFTPEELSALVRYICTIERPINRYRKADGLTLAQRRGKVVFERETTNGGRTLARTERCVGCHVGAYRTDRQRHAVGTTLWFDAPVDLSESDIFDADAFGRLGGYYFIDQRTPTLEFDVPHLRNVADEAPFLHNGAARSLEEVWTRFNMVERHGVTADLTRQQLNDLIAYLKAQ